MKTGYAKITDGEGCYVYDTATNAIVGISLTAFKILEDYLRLGPRAVRQKFAGRLSGRELGRAVEFLRACQRRGMLQPLRRLNYLSITGTANLRKHFARGLQRMTLGLTERCNQQCSYCPFGGAGDGAPRRGAMDWETARRSIHYLLSHAAAGPAPILELYGGEPLLNWPVVERAIVHVRRELRRPDVQIVLYTNATLLDRSRLELLMANRVVLQVSLDGPAHVHDKARTLADGHGTHAGVLRVLHFIRRRNPVYYRNCVQLHCTFSLEDDLLEVFRYFSRPLFRDLEISFGYRMGAFGASRADRARHEAQLDELTERYLRALRERRRFHRGLFAAIMGNLFAALELRRVGKADQRPQPNGACIPGQTRVFVSMTGSFHPCENYNRTGSEIGNCRSGIELAKSRALLRTYACLCNRMCQGCWAWRLCSHCFLHSMGAGGRASATRKQKACRAEKEQILRSLRRYLYIWRNEPAWASKVKDTARYSKEHHDD